MSELQQQFNNQNNHQNGVMAQASSSREMEEVKGQIFMARQFPRNVFQSEQRILDACKRPSLAETAIYSYPRGGTRVEGPSIRLAEVLAQNWGNLAFGIKELEQREGESVAMAYAWDLETNVREEKVFTVPHIRYTRSGVRKLTDPRDIYEMVANNGARRLRACILGIIPGDIVEKAVEECNRTLTGNNTEPLKERISKSLRIFKEKYGVTQEQIEERFGYNTDAFTERDLLDLGKIYNSLKDGMSKVDDWFSKDIPKKQQESRLASDFKKELNGNNKTEENAKNDKKTNTEKGVKKDGEKQADFDID